MDKIDEVVDELLGSSYRGFILMKLHQSKSGELPVTAFGEYLDNDEFWDALEELDKTGKVEVIYPDNLDAPTKVKLVETGA